MSRLKDWLPTPGVSELYHHLQDALIEAGLPSDEVELSSQISIGFLQTAVDLLRQEPGYRASDADALIPFEEDQANKVLQLFARGLIHASIKAWSYQVTGTPKSTILQWLALELFSQAKQIVTATIGQEATPELQFDDTQLETWMKQIAEGGLAHQLNEYERQFGPLQPIEEISNKFSKPKPAPVEAPPEAPPPLPSPAVAYEPAPLPQPAYEDPAPVSTPTVRPLSEATLNKLAALGLFLSTAPAEIQSQWLHSLSETHQPWVHHYMNPQAVLAERDPDAVAELLEQLQATLHPTVHATQGTEHDEATLRWQQVHHQLQHFGGADVVFSLFVSERLRLKQWLFEVATHPLPPAPLPNDAEKHQGVSLPTLSPALQQCVQRYLSHIESLGL